MDRFGRYHERLVATWRSRDNPADFSHGLGLNLVSTGIGVCVWLVSVALLQMMAKVDAHLSKIYLRYLRYRPYYPARTRLSPME